MVFISIRLYQGPLIREIGGLFIVKHVFVVWPRSQALQFEGLGANRG